MKKLVITPELALTIKLLDDYEAGEFINALIDYAGGERGISPSDFAKPTNTALTYWFAHIDDITITEV